MLKPAKHYDAEKQMLREFFYLLAPQLRCCFCHQPLLSPDALPEKLTFGHRRHTKVRVGFTVHHIDQNRSNNDPTNLAVAHTDCHKVFHLGLRRQQKANPPEQNLERKEEESNGR